jgi:hypothetical protein
METLNETQTQNKNATSLWQTIGMYIGMMVGFLYPQIGLGLGMLLGIAPLPVNANAIGRINSPIPVTSCIKSVSSYTSILQSTKKDIFLSFFDIFFSFFFCSIKIRYTFAYR